MAEKGDLRTLQIIWMALVVGVATYSLVIFALISSGTLALGELDPAIVNIIAAVTLPYMGAGLFVRRALVARIPDDADPAARMSRYRTAVIVALALTESGGLVIITLGMLASSAAWVLAGGGAAVGMMLMGRPSGDEIGAG